MKRVRTWLRQVSGRDGEDDGEDTVSNLPFLRRSDTGRGADEVSDGGERDGAESIASGCVSAAQSAGKE